jgi:hypothetical protein
MNDYGFKQEPEWSVWVGGSEVNDYLLRLQDAQDLANSYEREGYTDVALRQEKK